MTRSAILVLTILAVAGCSSATAPLRTAAGGLKGQGVTGGPFVFVGGGGDQASVEQAIARLAGGQDGRMVVIPTASDTPAQSGLAYQERYRALGLGEVRVLLPDGEPTPDELVTLQNATGFFFTGGEQARILAGMKAPGWSAAVRTAWKRGAVVAGTSAGAMVWGTHAILGGESMPTLWGGEQGTGSISLSSGFGLFEHGVVDTHFSQRGRFGRLLYAAKKHPSTLGIGVDPQTALILHPDRSVEVLGKGTVTLVRPFDQGPLRLPFSSQDVRVRMLAGGDRQSLAGDPVFDPADPR